MRIWLKNNLGWLFILILALAPMILWSAMTPLSSRFIDLMTTLTSLGQLTGLIGTVLFSLNLVLASRHRYLEKFFFGLNQAYFNHHWLGGSAFILLLFHPLLLVIKYIPLSIALAAQFFLPLPFDIAKSTGILALALMIVLLWLTFYIRPRYQLWKTTHKFLGLAFWLASLHVYFIPSDVARSLPLRIYMLVFIVLGFLAILYRTVLNAGKKKNLQ